MGSVAISLVPTAYDVVWVMLPLLMLSLTTVAVLSLIRSVARHTATHAFGWALVIIFLPLIGPLLWLTVGRRSVHDAHTHRLLR